MTKTSFSTNRSWMLSVRRVAKPIKNVFKSWRNLTKKLRNSK
jgi:hypothetical protein